MNHVDELSQEKSTMEEKFLQAEEKGRHVLNSLLKDISPTHAFSKYEQAINEKRLQVVERLSSAVAESTPEIFLRMILFYSAGGYHVTKPVEHWIQSAGKSCQNLSYTKLGLKLIQHAGHEAGHESMHLEDLKRICKLYEEKFHKKADPQTYLNQSLSRGVLNYIGLHEDTIVGNEPFGQIAIEYEIERLSITIGPSFLRRCFEMFGLELLQNLEFVADHAKLDLGHTIYNRDSIKDFLEENPHTLNALIKKGELALEYFTQYVEDAHFQAKS